MLSGKTFFILGSTGRLGCATVNRLEELGAAVVPLVLGKYPLKPKRVNWPAKTHPIKVNNPNDLNKLPKPDYVINFHWQIDRTLRYTEQLIHEIDNNIHRINFMWDWLLNKAVRRFVNISSIKVFSHLNQNPVSVNTEPRPISPYGVAKVAAERFFDAYFQDSSYPVIHLRLCSVMSFGEHPSHLISQLYNSAFKNKRVTINTGHTTYIMYIDEVVDLIISAALIAEKQRYIVTTPGIKTDQVASKFEQISGRRISAEYTDLEPGRADPIFVSDIEELQGEWIRYTSLESAIKKIIELNQRSDSAMLHAYDVLKGR